jgi:hypothetical protein
MSTQDDAVAGVNLQGVLQENMLVWASYEDTWHPAYVMGEPEFNEDFGCLTCLVGFMDGTGAPLPLEHLQVMQSDTPDDDPRMQHPDAPAAMASLRAAYAEQGAEEAEDQAKALHKAQKKREKEQRKEQEEEERRAKKAEKEAAKAQKKRASKAAGEGAQDDDDIYEKAPVPAMQKSAKVSAPKRGGFEADLGGESGESDDEGAAGGGGGGRVATAGFGGGTYGAYTKDLDDNFRDLLHQAQEYYAGQAGAARDSTLDGLYVMPVTEEAVMRDLRAELVKRQAIVSSLRGRLKEASATLTYAQRDEANRVIKRLASVSRDEEPFAQFFRIVPVRVLRSGEKLARDTTGRGEDGAAEAPAARKPAHHHGAAEPHDPLIFSDQSILNFDVMRIEKAELESCENFINITASLAGAARHRVGMAAPNARAATQGAGPAPKLMRTWEALRRKARGDGEGEAPRVAPARSGFALTTRGPTRVTLTEFGESKRDLIAAPVYSNIAYSASFADEVPKSDEVPSGLHGGAASVRRSEVIKSVLPLPSEDVFAVPEPRASGRSAISALGQLQAGASRAPSVASAQSRVTAATSASAMRAEEEGETWRAKAKRVVRGALTPYLRGTEGCPRLIADDAEFAEVGTKLLKRIVAQKYHSLGLTTAFGGSVPGVGLQRRRGPARGRLRAPLHDRLPRAPGHGEGTAGTASTRSEAS